ncbi:hypothetical protein GGD57_001153 [Rhizobium esperanzae]|uniref:Uncharacterized protein n=1 Tax=Rhizobium esperanzae TaxID=1967781 RepID=A0A7W6W3K2_9HYPH|nr:hypothetical protein [Rhizobium esperanzae]
MLLGTLGKILGADADLARAAVDLTGLLGNRTQGLLELRDGGVEIGSQAFEIGASKQAGGNAYPANQTKPANSNYTRMKFLGINNSRAVIALRPRDIFMVF